MLSRSGLSALKLLIVEDEIELCRAMAREACALGHDVECTHTIAQTRKILSSKRSSCPYAIALLDLRLSDGDSSELVPELRSMLPAPVIVVVSAYLTSKRILELCELGVTLSLPKPVVLGDLIERIGSLKSESEVARGQATVARMRLSYRQEQVLECAHAGLSPKETAVQLGISVNTVRTYWHRILDRAGMDNERRAIAALGERGD